MAAPGGDKDHPIEIASTDDERNAALATTTDSEPPMTLSDYARNGYSETPRPPKNARQGDSTTPRASVKVKQPSASPTKGKQRATVQVYPLHEGRIVPTIESDDDKKPSPVARSQTGPSPQNRALSPVKSSRPRRKHEIQPSSAAGSWLNPEPMVFSDGHIVSISSASESEKTPARGSRLSRMVSGSPAGPSTKPLINASVASASAATASQQPSTSLMTSATPSAKATPAFDAGSREGPISYKPSYVRPDPTLPLATSVVNRAKRRPSPPSPQPDASTSSTKHARLDPDVGPMPDLFVKDAAMPVKLRPTWKTHSSSPVPPPSVRVALETAQEVEMDDINQVSATLGEDIPLDEATPGATAPSHSALSIASPVVIPPIKSPSPTDHAAPVKAIRQSATTADHNTSMSGVSSVLRPSDPQNNISGMALPSVDFDVIMDDWLTSAEDAVVSNASDGEVPILPQPERGSPVANPSPPSTSNLTSQQRDQKRPHPGGPIRSSPSSQVLQAPSSPQLVERAVEIMREGVADVDLNAASRSNISRSPSFEEISSEAYFAKVPVGSSTRKPPLLRTRSSQKKPEPSLSVEEEQAPVKVLHLGRYETMSRSEWRSLVEKEHLAENGLSTDSDIGSPSSSRSTIQKLDDQLYASLAGQPTGSTQQPPEDRRGLAKREFNSAQIDEWNRRAPFLTHNPALHRRIFEAFTAEKELNGGISVSNEVDNEGAPPDFEFEYSNDMLYHPDVPDPEKSLGCDCDGPCDPKAGCSCVKRQEAYYGNLDLDGFAYDESGLAIFPAATIWECSETCGCPPSCTNRVIQHGRKKETKIEIFKTRNKGWGVRAKVAMPRGQFIGIYSGELITETESEKRGVLYDEIGRTYIFDLDGWHLRNPPDGLAEIDPRLAETTATTAQRANEVQACFEDDDESYSAYSVDAFHYGNYTRYFNHSCDPNLEIAQCYVYDFHPERPLLCIFTRRPIAKNEEMCISYKGIPDELPVLLTPPRNGRKGKRGKMNSTKAHISHLKNSGKPARHPCFCRSWNCDGSMFN